MNHSEKISWMALWAVKNHVVLELEGECGFGRECVGVLYDGCYPSYEWYDEDYERVDKNGEVWTPVDAYHKSPCVAVLGRGEEAESQLYEWLKWFDGSGFKVKTAMIENPCDLSKVELLLGRATEKRMVKKVDDES